MMIDWMPLLYVAIFAIAMLGLHWAITRPYVMKNPTYCQGCDQIQPLACFRWTAIGLWRCSECRREPQLLDQAKALPKPSKDWASAVVATTRGAWATAIINTGRINLAEDRAKMQALAHKCRACGKPARHDVYGHWWCVECWEGHTSAMLAKAHSYGVGHGQFDRITSSSIKWRCDQPGTGTDDACTRTAEWYEWHTGRRYCDRHMKMQPRPTFPEERRDEHNGHCNCTMCDRPSPAFRSGAQF